MACKKCDWKGYIETVVLRDNIEAPAVYQCCDVAAYSKRVQELRGDTKPEEERDAKVIPFPKVKTYPPGAVHRIEYRAQAAIDVTGAPMVRGLLAAFAAASVHDPRSAETIEIKPGQYSVRFKVEAEFYELGK